MLVKFFCAKHFVYQQIWQKIRDIKLKIIVPVQGCFTFNIDFSTWFALSFLTWSSSHSPYKNSVQAH